MSIENNHQNQSLKSFRKIHKSDKSVIHFLIAVDTGGTFTDCIAVDQNGTMHTCKVLSTSTLRGSITEWLDAQTFIVQNSWLAKRDIFRHYRFRLLTPPLSKGVLTDSKTAEKSEPVQFKVQIISYQSDIDEVNVKKLSRVADLGDFETENATINGLRFTRVMFSFNTYEAAAAALRTVKDRSLSDAFVVRYENGKRTNKSR